MLVVAALPASAEEVLHTSGARWNWPGRDETGDYHRSPEDALLERTARFPDRGTTGGFSRPLFIRESLGAYAFPETPSRVNALLAPFRRQVRGTPAFLAQVEAVAADPAVYEVLKRFLAEGGRYEEVETGGRYTPVPFRIIASLRNEAGQVSGKTIFHELLHSMFDRMDSVLWELVTPGGADHLAIDALEDRYFTVQQFLNGGDVLHPGMGGLYGFTRQGKLAEVLRPELTSAKPAQIQAAVARVDSDAFYGNWVRSGMVTVLSSVERARSATDIASRNQLEAWNPGRQMDLAFLQAWNAQVYRAGVKLAAQEALRSRRSIEAVVAAGSTAPQFRAFLQRWTRLLETDPVIGPAEAFAQAFVLN